MTVETFTNVTPSHIEAMIAKLESSHGVIMTQTGPQTYCISGSGVKAEASYDPATLILTVDVEKHPWLISEGGVRAKIQAALDS